METKGMVQEWKEARTVRFTDVFELTIDDKRYAVLKVKPNSSFELFAMGINIDAIAFRLVKINQANNQPVIMFHSTLDKNGTISNEMNRASKRLLLEVYKNLTQDS